MKRVLFVATVNSHITNFHLPYLKYFHDNGYEVHVATESSEEIKYCDIKHQISITRSPFRFSNLKAIRELKKIIQDNNFEIIHCHTPMGGVITRLSANNVRKNGTRVIYTAHGFHFYKGSPLLNWLIYYPIEKFLSRYTDTLITINEEDFNRVKDKFKCHVEYVPGVGLCPTKYNIIFSEQEKKELRKSLNIKKTDKVLIYTAEISKRKNQIWLIKTLNDLIKNNPKIHLLLPGKDSLNGLCQKLTEELGIDANIHFLGFRNDISKLLQISDIAVSSSNQEGLPVNIMEALFIGKPIVATNCRGNRDLLDKKQLVNIGDSEGFNNKILETLSTVSNKTVGLSKKFMLENVMLQMKSIYNIEKKSTTLAIVTSGVFPVPATKGGAVETLIENFIIENEKTGKLKIEIISIYDENAENHSNYKYTKRIYLKPGSIIKIIDEIVFNFYKNILKKEKLMPYKNIFQRYFFLRKSSRIIKRNNYNRVLLENSATLFLVMKWYRNYIKYANKYYFHLHNEITNVYGCQKLIEKSANNICVSNYIKNYLKDFLKLKNQNLSVLKNAINLRKFNINISDFEKDSIKRNLNIKDEKVILYVGRLTKEKGIKELILALQKLKHENYKLVVVGSYFFDVKITSPFLEELNELVKNNQEKIIFTGFVPYQDVSKYYAIANMCIVPSVCEDAAPLTILEALNSGLPIVTTNSGGIPEYVNNNCAIICDKNKNFVDNLSLGIKKLLNDDKLCLKMQKESLRIAKSLTFESYYKKLLELLNID